MTISLTPELEKFVEDQVSTGRYKSHSEVIRAGLRSLADHELKTWLREGLDALEQGEKVEARAAVARIRERLRIVS